MGNFRKDGALPIRVLCTVFFLSFTFVYLYFYQADILAVTGNHYPRSLVHSAGCLLVYQSAPSCPCAYLCALITSFGYPD